jgi:hypothetical protein
VLTTGSAPLADMREPLAAALHWVFLTAALLMGVGVVASSFMRALPMRGRRNYVLRDDDDVSPTPSEPYRLPARASGVPRPR